MTTILYDSFLNIDKDMVKYRLLNSLAFKLLDGEIVENQEIDDIMRTKIKTIQNIYTFIYTDILELILSINEQNLSKNMIKIKYDLIFLFKIIEERMLVNNFKVNNNPYLINNCVTSFNYLEANYLKRIKDSITARIILDQLDDLLNKKNDYFINPDNMSKAITKQIIVRATMVIASEDVRNDIIETFKDVMDDEDLSQYLCIKIIKDSLSCFKQDIKIPKFVYFKKM